MSKKAPTAEDLFADLESLPSAPSAPAQPSKRKTAANKPAPKAAPVPKQAPQETADPLAGLEELSNLAKAKPTSRPNTPRLKKEAATPSSTGSARTSEDKPAHAPRKSQESARHHAGTPSGATSGLTREQRIQDEEEEEDDDDDDDEVEPPKPAPVPQKQEKSSGGGWWGWGSNVVSAATAAASTAVSEAQKRAEAAVKEIQKNEEAQRWAEQVKGNVKGLRGLDLNDLRTKALPQLNSTFTSLLHTLAPPISAHERLAIHTTHDLENYPSLDPLVFAVFSRVMSQVEGGDLLVYQRHSSSETGYTGGSAAGWNDGPWWRAGGERSINSVVGIREGSKLARASAEGYAHEFFGTRGGVEAAAKSASEALSESNPVRSSDIFLAIQALTYEAPKEWFAGSAEEGQEPEELLAFATFLHDPIHSISFSNLSQPLPSKWIHWLDASAATNGTPEEIKEIIDDGGLDPREWVAEWIEETLSLGIGVVAQRYVAKRMGVGEGGGKGRLPARQEASESGAGEAARAGVI